MKNASLKKFAALRNSLVNEKRDLEQRLAEINAVLGSEAAPAAAAAPARRAVGRPRLSAAVKRSRKAAAKPARRMRNEVSLKQLVAQLTAGKPMTKDEIFKAVEKTGYKFTTKKPMASLNVALYTKGLFKNNGGKFSPAK